MVPAYYGVHVCLLKLVMDSHLSGMFKLSELVLLMMSSGYPESSTLNPNQVLILPLTAQAQGIGSGSLALLRWRPGQAFWDLSAAGFWGEGCRL